MYGYKYIRLKLYRKIEKYSNSNAPAKILY